MTYAKSLVAFVGAFLSALLLEWTGGPDALTTRDLVVALAAALASGALVFAVPNRSARV